MTVLGGYAATAITALTAQDTRDVHAVFPIPPAFVARQMEVVLADIGADCIKTGMLHSAAVIATVVEVLTRAAPGTPLVVDPVTVAKGGAPLLEPNAIDAVRGLLLPRATVATPNIPEAELLTGGKIASVAAMEAAGRALLALGPKAVLVKGGHLDLPTVVDVLVTADGAIHMENPRIHSTNTHGTGCTLASAIATGLAQGMNVRDAVVRARGYVWEAIRTAPGLGKGHGPLNHARSL